MLFFIIILILKSHTQSQTKIRKCILCIETVIQPIFKKTHTIKYWYRMILISLCIIPTESQNLGIICFSGTCFQQTHSFSYSDTIQIWDIIYLSRSLTIICCAIIFFELLPVQSCYGKLPVKFSLGQGRNKWLYHSLLLLFNSFI